MGRRRKLYSISFLEIEKWRCYCGDFIRVVLVSTPREQNKYLAVLPPPPSRLRHGCLLWPGQLLVHVGEIVLEFFLIGLGDWHDSKWSCKIHSFVYLYRQNAVNFTKCQTRGLRLCFTKGRATFVMLNFACFDPEILWYN